MQDGGEGAGLAQIVPELRGGGVEGADDLAQRGDQGSHAAEEPGPGAAEAAGFLFGGGRRRGLARVGLGVKMGFQQGDGDVPVGEEIVGQHADGARLGGRSEVYGRDRG